MEQKNIKINLNNIGDIKKFIKVVSNFMSDVDIIADRVVLDAKSIMALYSLDLSQDVYVRIISDDVIECRNFDDAMEEFR